VTRLPFENEDDILIYIDIKVEVDGNGVFQCVRVGEGSISIESWNKMFENGSK